jgi:hypothetical protein
MIERQARLGQVMKLIQLNPTETETASDSRRDRAGASPWRDRLNR